MPEIVERSCDTQACERLEQAGIDPILARIYAARGLGTAEDLDVGLSRLLPFAGMRNLERLAAILADAIEQARRILIVGDYDCDGATACAVGVLALRAFGAKVEYLVPNRFDFGYGLTPEIVRIAAQRQPDFLVTVDNGIASVDGVAAANALGMQVLITDHHLPGAQLPEAACIVNPNQAGCEFPSKHLAGVGVMFYAMLALRAELRRRGSFGEREAPNLAELLDLVALGTVADVVRLDRNNRVLVEQGLRRIRVGRCRPGITALLNAAGRNVARATTYDLGFVAGPRINAAGRLDDITLGIECLLAQSTERADELARQLDQLNRDRRGIEKDMQAGALAHLESIEAGEMYGLSVYREDWHQGVIGILAARLRERFHRPVIAFAAGADGELKGSGRSTTGLHLRDALDLLDKRQPGLMLRFGGHAGAAGLSIRAGDFARFRDGFDALLRELLSAADLERRIETDGALAAERATLALAEAIGTTSWGQGFPAPRFHGVFHVLDQRVVGEAHLKLQLAAADESPRTASPVQPPHKPDIATLDASDGRGMRGARRNTLTAMLFRHADPLPARIRAVFALEVNEWKDARTLQLTIDYWEPAH